ncbi:MAG: glycosyltransferase family 4 protein [bacterium]
MKINFIIPFTYITGGIRVIFEYANRLTEKGHIVNVIYPLKAYNFGDTTLKGFYWQTKGSLRNLIKGKKINWIEINFNLLQVPFITDMFVPDADAVIATAWPTAYSVYNLSKKKGEKFYFIQHYEIWSGQKELVDKTYNLSLYQITIASWLERLLKEKFNSKKLSVIVNAVDINLFYNDQKTYNKNKRILMLYSQHKWKGVEDGIRAFEIAKKSYPNIELIMFGVKKYPDVPSYVEFYENPKQEKIREIYCSCDIFISPSWTEGCQLPPMEAMACKCAVIATNIGGIPDYTIPGKTALVSEPKDINKLAEHLIFLLGNENELKRLSFAGYEYIKNFTWEKAVKKFEKVLEEGLRNK